MKRPKVFISYTHADGEFVDKLVDNLQASGIDVWIDKWEIGIGDSIVDKINEGIKESDYLIVVLSKKSVKSPWVREELNAATLKNIESEKRAYILPVLLEECDIPDLLKHRRYANFKDDPETALEELLEALRPTEEVIPAYLLSIDATVRYVLALCLQHENPGRFKEINDWCVGYFWDALQRSGEDLQRAFVREWLFHRIMQLNEKLSLQERLDLLREDLRRISLRSIAKERTRDKLVAEVMGDGELKNLLIEYLGYELYLDLLQELTQLEVQS